MRVGIESSTTIAPHGGTLVDRRPMEEERADRLQKAAELPKVRLGGRNLSDLEMIATGVFSPLTGFMTSNDYESVVATMHLSDGLVWSMPITLSVNKEEAKDFKEGEEVALTDSSGRIVATMLVEDRYSYNKEHEANEVYRTTDEKHPGVAALNRQGDTLIGAFSRHPSRAPS